MEPRRKGLGLAVWLVAMVAFSPASGAAQDTKIFARASWLERVQAELYTQVKRDFKTRYDGAIWARSCGDQAMAAKLSMHPQRLRAWIFERLLLRKDAAKISPQEKWLVVNGVVTMTSAYLEGAKAFVRRGKEECRIVLRGLRREFRD